MTINLNKNLIAYDLNATTRKDAISQLTDLYVKSGIVTDKQKYLDAVEVREAEGTTGIGDGIAIPHGKTAAVTSSQVAIAKLKQPLEWAALDDEPVKFVFLLAIPDGGDNEHLSILSEIASQLMDDDVRDVLNHADSVEMLSQVFNEE